MERTSKRTRLERMLYAFAVAGAVTLLCVGTSAHAAGSGTPVVLTDATVHNLATATRLGPVPAAQRVTVGVFLQSSNQAAEDAYVKQLYDPASPNYQNFLDPDSFALQFGVPAATLQAAQSWLSSGGLTVSTVDGTSNYLVASGTATQIAALLATPLNNYSAGGRTFYANAVAPTVPASLGIGAVLGLNNVNRFSLPRVASTGTTKTTTSTVPTAGNVPNTGLLSPKALWSIYDQPDTNLANGQSMAIFGWGVTTPIVPDLRSFESEWQLPQVPITVKLFGATDTPDTSGDGATVEWELDTQASTGMAPNVQGETLYFGHHNTDADLLAAIAGWVNDRHGPLQGSASFGECENIPAAEGAIGSDQMEAAGDKLLEQAAAEGRTLFASTGDTGSSCPVVPVDTNGVATQVYPGLEWPSVSPWAVAVGGTDLTSDGGSPQKRLAETAWEFTGGGNSTTEPAGTYQQGVAPDNCTFDQSGNPYVPGVNAGPVCRSTPDVAAISGDVATGNGMSITDDNGTDQQGAGTSLSSPLWLGMWTRIQAAASGKGLGFANYALYRVAKASAGRDFYDITVGDNQPYPAKPGYDNASGWGTPEVSQLMLDLTGRLTPTRNAPAGPLGTTSSTTCGSLFSDPSGDDVYAVEGQTLGAEGAQPQLDILSAKMLLSSDGQTLRTIITVRNLSTTIPTGGVENDYNLVWSSADGSQLFTQLAVEPNGTVEGYDGELVHAALEDRYQQLHLDTGVITPGPNGTVEVDVPLANIGSPALGAVLHQPAAASYVREGAVAGPLEPIDSAGPGSDYVLGSC